MFWKIYDFQLVIEFPNQFPNQFPNEFPNEFPNHFPNQFPNEIYNQTTAFNCKFKGQGVSVDPSMPVRDIELRPIRIQRGITFENPTKYKEMAAINVGPCSGKFTIFIW